MKIKYDDLWLCSDCTQVAVNGIYGTDIEDTPQGNEILSALSAPEFRHLVPHFDSNENEGLLEFSSIPCAVCKTSLAGYRARFAILA